MSELSTIADVMIDEWGQKKKRFKKLWRKIAQQHEKRNGRRERVIRRRSWIEGNPLGEQVRG
jgi:hypothetical protein